MAWVMWFTGLPGCGKTTIADRVKAKLSEKGMYAKILQLDEIRRAITPEPKYTEEERDIVYASLAYMAKLLADEGINVMIDATANRRRYRDFARHLIPNFAEVFIRAPLEICRSREAKRKAKFSPKGIYKKACRKGGDSSWSQCGLRRAPGSRDCCGYFRNERRRECQVYSGQDPGPRLVKEMI